MTILEMFKTKNAEEIAEYFSKDYKEDFGCHGLDVGHCSEYFDVSHECEEHNCEYLETGNTYEDYWMNGMCNLERYEDECAKCPYKIDRNDVLKRDIIKWLNKEIEQA